MNSVPVVIKTGFPHNYLKNQLFLNEKLKISLLFQKNVLPLCNYYNIILILQINNLFLWKRKKKLFPE